MVKEGKAVATFPWSFTEERNIEVLYPKTPLMISREKAYFLKEKYPKGIEITSLEQLKPYKMVGVLGYWYESAAKNAGINCHMVSNAQVAWKVLDKKRADVYLENELVAKEDMMELFGKSANKFGSSSKPIRTSDMFCLFSRVHPDSVELMKKIDDALNKMSVSGEIERILKK